MLHNILSWIKRHLLVIPLAILAFLFLFYYPVVGWLWSDHIYDDVNYKLENPQGSQIVDQMITLVNREVNDHGWLPNNPLWYSTVWLDNTPNYQLGIISSVSRVAESLRDDVGRSRGSSQEDADLNDAVSRFKIDPTLWFWQPSVSLLPQASAETHYRHGIESLQKYNARLVNHQAVFDTRADNLIALLERISKDLGSTSGMLEYKIKTAKYGWFDLTGDDVFYNVKGRVYAYCMILQGARNDFSDVLKSKNLITVWDQMQGGICEAAALDPLIISNAPADSAFEPAHLASLGFDLVRGRIQMNEVLDVLQK